MLKQPLHAGWTVRPVSSLSNVPANCRDAIPATVPGCVHTDLLRAGKIPDPYHDRNEPTLRWIGQTDWRYETTFTAGAGLFEHERVDLAADGLDTVARIELNGQLVASTENMHVGYRFDVKPHLRPGENSLAITFSSAEHYALAMEQRLGKLPFLTTRLPFNMIRKMACNFGWDWGPELITCGVWRGIRLEGWSHFRIQNVSVQTLGISAETGAVSIVVDVEPSAADTAFNHYLNIEISNAEGYSGTILAALDRPQKVILRDISYPELWWPSGYGKPSLYDLKVAVETEDDLLVEETQLRFGLRTIELDTSPDDIGAKFAIKVNGKPVFCKGFNWIPDDVFLDRACTPERYRTRIQQALGANANMLRVWGGGIFETDDFYDICDELGILVWQDCLFACAAYPEEAPFWSSVEQELRYNVARLSHHASLALWNGCNENLWGYHEWGWKRDGTVKNRTWGLGYYFDLIPKIVKELDPSRPYWAASPWSGDTDVDEGLFANLASHGNKHVWEVWSEPYEVFRKFTPRFCSEFGFQAPPNYATLAGCMPAEQLKIGSESMQLHQKSPSWDTQVAKRVADVFGEDPDRSFDDQHYLLQVNQARALQTGVEWFRSRMPICMGALYWQLNDCWPVNSWAAIDGDGRLKPLWYATRRFYTPRLLTIQPIQDMYELCAVNDTDESWESPATITLHDLAGGQRVVKRMGLAVPPRSVQRIALADAMILRPDRARQFIVADAGAERAFWFYEPDRQLAHVPPAFQASATHAGGVTRLSITAQTLLRDVLIQSDRLDPQSTISDNLITVLPGETVVFDIRSNHPLSPEALSSRPVFNCANYFGKR